MSTIAAAHGDSARRCTTSTCAADAESDNNSRSEATAVRVWDNNLTVLESTHTAR
jgi:hypothetical protein